MKSVSQGQVRSTSELGQNEPCQSLRQHGRSTSISGPAGPAVGTSGSGRYCCKSLFALLIKNSLGCRRDFRVKMWGTSSPDRKLTGDLGNAIESTEIDGRRSCGPLAGKLSPGDFRLLQQYRPIGESRSRRHLRSTVVSPCLIGGGFQPPSTACCFGA